MLDEKKVLGLLEKIEKNVNEQVEELSDAVDLQGKEIAERGGTTAETKEKISGLEGELKSLTEAMDELKELAPQLQELKGEIERPGSPSHKGRTSPGSSFVGSDEYKNFIEGRESRSRPYEIGDMSGLLPSRKAITSDEGIWGGAGVFIQPQELPGVLTDPLRQLRLRDLVNVQPVSTDSVRYFMETGFANLYTELVSAAAAAATTIAVRSVSGFFAGQTIMVAGQAAVIAAGGVDSAANTLTLTAGLTTGVSSGAEVVSDQLAGTPHGGRKPEASIRYSDEVTAIITIAHWIAAHRQTLEDAPQMQGNIDTRLLYGLDMALENQGLYGTGTSTTLLGIMNHPNIQDQGQRAGVDANNRAFTEIDWIRKALTKAMVAEYPVNGIMVNPLNWESIELAKDDQGRYLWITVTENGVRRLFGVPAVVSTAMRAGEFLTGAFGLGVTLFDRQQANIRVSDSHEDFFVRNALAILAELRAGLAVTRPESLIKGRF